MKKLIALVATMFLAFGLSACSPEKHSVTISDPWVRSSEYSAAAGGMTGIFATLTNNTDKDITLTGGKTDAAAMVQTHKVVGGMMQEVKGGLVIPAGGTLTLEPGGLPVMLMGLTNAIVAGDKIDFTFTFDDGSEQTFTLTAKPADGGDEHY